MIRHECWRCKRADDLTLAAMIEFAGERGYPPATVTVYDLLAMIQDTEARHAEREAVAAAKAIAKDCAFRFAQRGRRGVVEYGGQFQE